MWGLRSKARQIRETADWDMPFDLAIDRVDQCVSPFGGACSKVAAMAFSTCSSVTVRGRLGRGSHSALPAETPGTATATCVPSSLISLGRRPPR
jgi:hypothetical protein